MTVYIECHKGKGGNKLRRIDIKVCEAKKCFCQEYSQAKRKIIVQKIAEDINDNPSNTELPNVCPP